MDYTSAERQEKQRQRDFDNGIVYLQVRISEETRDILRDHARGKKMKLAEYVRERLDFIAEQIVRQNSAQHSLPGCEKPQPTPAPAATKPAQPVAQPQAPISPEAAKKLLAVLDAFGSPRKSAS